MLATPLFDVMFVMFAIGVAISAMVPLLSFVVLVRRPRVSLPRASVVRMG